MKILVKTKKVIQTISKLLNELMETDSEVRIRIDSVETIIDSDGKIIGTEVYRPHLGKHPKIVKISVDTP